MLRAFKNRCLTCYCFGFSILTLVPVIFILTMLLIIESIPINKSQEAKSDVDSAPAPNHLTELIITTIVLLLLIWIISFYARNRTWMKGLLALALFFIYIKWFVASCISIHFFADRIHDTNGIAGLMVGILNVMAVLGMAFCASLHGVYSCTPRKEYPNLVHNNAFIHPAFDDFDLDQCLELIMIICWLIYCIGQYYYYYTHIPGRIDKEEVFPSLVYRCSMGILGMITWFCLSFLLQVVVYLSPVLVQLI